MSVGKISYIDREGCIRVLDSGQVLPNQELEPLGILWYAVVLGEGAGIFLEYELDLCSVYDRLN
jgi:hypothetical protein